MCIWQSSRLSQPGENGISGAKSSASRCHLTSGIVLGRGNDETFNFQAASSGLARGDDAVVRWAAGFGSMTVRNL